MKVAVKMKKHANIEKTFIRKNICYDCDMKIFAKVVMRMVEKLVAWCDKENPQTKEENMVTQYGAELLVGNCFKICLLLMLGFVLHKGYETMIFLSVFCSLRTQAGSGICGAYVDYVKNTGSIKYDINGTYRDIAGLASFVASVLALPAAPAMGVAKSIFAAFGFASGAASVLIPSCNLSSNYEEIEYTLTDMSFSSHKNSFYGTKYTITEAGKHINDVYIEGDYYPTTSWNNHNFGTAIYTYMFNYSNWRIYAWN